MFSALGEYKLYIYNLCVAIYVLTYVVYSMHEAFIIMHVLSTKYCTYCRSIEFFYRL